MKKEEKKDEKDHPMNEPMEESLIITHNLHQEVKTDEMDLTNKLIFHSYILAFAKTCFVE